MSVEFLEFDGLAICNRGLRVPVTQLIESLLACDRLRSVAIVVIEHPAEPLTTLHFATMLANFVAHINDLFSKP